MIAFGNDLDISVYAAFLEAVTGHTLDETDLTRCHFLSPVCLL